MVIPEAEALVELIRSRNKPLAWIWITHAHPDHYAGLAVVAAAFPDAQLLAHPQTATRAPELRNEFDEPLQKFFPGLMAAPVELTPYTAQSLGVDGVELSIVTFEGGEHELATALLVPSLEAMLIADLVYNRGVWPKSKPFIPDTADLVLRTWRRHRYWRTMAGLRFSATAHIKARDQAKAGNAEAPTGEPADRRSLQSNR